MHDGSPLKEQLLDDPERASYHVQVPFVPQAKEEVKVKGTAGSSGGSSHPPGPAVC